MQQDSCPGRCGSCIVLRNMQREKTQQGKHGPRLCMCSVGPCWVCHLHCVNMAAHTANYCHPGSAQSRSGRRSSNVLRRSSSVAYVGCTQHNGLTSCINAPCSGRLPASMHVRTSSKNPVQCDTCQKTSQRMHPRPKSC